MPCCVNPRTRTNGYDCPNDPLQLTSWVLILLFAVTFFGLWVPQLSSVAEQAAILFYGSRPFYLRLNRQLKDVQVKDDQTMKAVP